MRRGVAIGSAIAVLVLGAAGALSIYQMRPSPPAPAQPQAAAPAAPVKPASVAATPAPAPPQPAPIVPRFDIVKVAPDGTAVIAGRAAPDARVEVLEGGNRLGSVTADARGEWVLIPEHAIAPGERLLSLRATGPKGGAAVNSAETVALTVAPHPREAALAVALPQDHGAPARLLQPDGGTGATLSLGAVQYGDDGRVALSGRAAAGATVRIFLGDKLFDTVTAKADGDWSAAPASAVPSDAGVLRLEQVAPDGHVTRQISVPFAASAATAARLPGETYTVKPGNNLWRIAERTYGKGTRYVVIFGANRPHIRNPNLIYPGQVLKLPKS